MTNEEYINQIVEIGNTLQIHPNSPKGQTLKKCIELLSAVSEREKGEWIPCSERLPKVGEICLLTVHGYGWNCEEYTRVIIGEYSDNYADHILAWMPLPEPYKAEKGGVEE